LGGTDFVMSFERLSEKLFKDILYTL